MKRMTIRGRAASLALIAGIALGGCSSSEGVPSGSGSASTVDKALPASVQKTGVLRIGAQIGFAPYEFFDKDGKTVIGFEPDLMDVIAKKLGVKVEWENQAFASLFTGLKTNRFDIIVNGVTISDERTKLNDYVTYSKDLYSVLVRKGNADGIASEAGFCGKKWSVLKGTTPEDYLRGEITKKCEASGSGGPTVLTFDGGTAALLAVKSGQADGTLAQTPQLAYYVQQSPNDYEVLDSPTFGEGLVGFVIPKDQPEYAAALKKAMSAMIEDGSYAKIMEKWGIAQLSVDVSEINPAVSGA